MSTVLAPMNAIQDLYASLGENQESLRRISGRLSHSGIPQTNSSPSAMLKRLANLKFSKKVEKRVNASTPEQTCSGIKRRIESTCA